MGFFVSLLGCLVLFNFGLVLLNFGLVWFLFGLDLLKVIFVYFWPFLRAFWGLFFRCFFLGFLSKSKVWFGVSQETTGKHHVVSKLSPGSLKRRTTWKKRESWL